MKFVNENGLQQLKAWILQTAKEGHACVDAKNLDAWASEAEESMGSGNPPMVEMKAIATTSGVPETFTISYSGVSDHGKD